MLGFDKTISDKERTLGVKCRNLEDDLAKRELECNQLRRELADSIRKHSAQMTEQVFESHKAALKFNKMEADYHYMAALKDGELKEKVAKLEDELIKVTRTTDAVAVTDLTNQLELSQKELKYTQELLKKYMELPDIKKLIEHIATFKIPSLEELKGLSDLGKSDELIRNLNALSDRIRDMERTFRNPNYPPEYRGAAYPR